MDLLLAGIYICLFSLLIWKSRLSFFGLPKIFVLAIFWIKSILGILYCFIHLREYGGGDTYIYFRDSEIIFESLFRHPLDYLRLTFGPNGEHIPERLSGYIYNMGFWGDTSDYMVVRFNAMVRLFSFGSFYVHSVFMSLLSLTGLIFLFGSAREEFKHQDISVLASSIFLIPSVLFWASGVHKEGLLIFGLGIFFYCLHLLDREEKPNRILAGLILSSLFIYLVRDFVFFLLLPGLIAFIISKKTGKAVLVFPAVYLLFILAGAWLPVFKGESLPMMIIRKQFLFTALEKGNSDIPLETLSPALTDLVIHVPMALRNALMAPVLVPNKSPFTMLAAAENIVLALAATIGVAFALTRKLRFSRLTLWFLLFSLSQALLIGFVVPNAGAIVRYRSIMLPFLFIFLGLQVTPRLFKQKDS